MSDKPGKVEVADHDNSSVDLKWEAPKSDNGAPIEKYIIQKKMKDSPDWENAGEVNKDDLRLSQIYRFNKYHYLPRL